jgi:hypothetical protein
MHNYVGGEGERSRSQPQTPATEEHMRAIEERAKRQAMQAKEDDEAGPSRGPNNS